MILSPFPLRRRRLSPQASPPQPIDDNGLDAVSGGASVATSDPTTGSDVLGDDDSAASRDAASGLPTGKRMHKPFTITAG